MDFLRPVGCLAFVRTQVGMNRPMAQPGVLTGFNIFRRLYRVFIKGTGRIIEARNVKFDIWERGYTARVPERPWEYDGPPIPQPNPLPITQEPKTEQKVFPKNEPDQSLEKAVPDQSSNDSAPSTFPLNDEDGDGDEYQEVDTFAQQQLPIAPLLPPPPEQEDKTVQRARRPPSTSQLNLRNSLPQA